MSISFFLVAIFFSFHLVSFVSSGEIYDGFFCSVLLSLYFFWSFHIFNSFESSLMIHTYSPVYFIIITNDVMCKWLENFFFIIITIVISHSDFQWQFCPIAVYCFSSPFLWSWYTVLDVFSNKISFVSYHFRSNDYNFYYPVLAVVPRLIQSLTIISHEICHMFYIDNNQPFA